MTTSKKENKYCEECFTLDPTIMHEHGSEVYDEPFGETTFTQHWTRESTECCDVDEVSYTDGDILDILVQETPKLIRFEYNDEQRYKLTARAVFSIDIALLNQIEALHGGEFTVCHPKILEPHNQRVTGDVVLREIVMYDWVEEILMYRVKYETDNYTAYKIALHQSGKIDEHTMTIEWKL